MTRRKTITIGAFIAMLALFAALSPFAWRAGVLYWEKRSVRRIFKDLTPAERANLNATPIAIALPPSNPDAQAIEAIKIGDYLVRIPKPTSHADEPGHLRLIYPRFEVIVRGPFPKTDPDSYAQWLHFKDSFDLWSASYHTRLDDLDTQPDLHSLRRFCLLISLKPPATLCREEFDRSDICGFIYAPVSGSNTTIVEFFLPESHAGGRLWFVNTGGLTLPDIHEFLAAVRFAKE